jgi:hypothetical protein
MSADDSEAIIVIDDFLNKPLEWRERALKAARFPREDNQPYPGRNSSERHVLPGLDQHVARLTGQTLVPAPDTSHGMFRLCLAEETGSGGVHIDTCHWSSILYLSLPEDCQGGTDFFRHRRTKTIRAPVFPGEKEQLPVSWEELRADMLPPNAKDMTRWERIRHVPMKFNRFVLFRPWLWHDAGPGFGTKIENGRLIYVAFYNCIDPGWV